MSDLTVERILAMASGTDTGDVCWRCDARPSVSTTGLCGSCRAWLLDPGSHSEPSRSISVDVEAYLSSITTAGANYGEMLERLAASFAEVGQAFARCMSQVARVFAETAPVIAEMAAKILAMANPPPKPPRWGPRTQPWPDPALRDMRATATGRNHPPRFHHRA